MKIGLVEDDERVRRSFARAIGQSQEFVLWFESSSVAGAVEWMQTCPRADWPGIWLVDLGLPDGDGLTVIRQALARHPETQVMVVSVFGDESKVLDSIEAGAAGYILKGEGDADLVAHIGDLLRGGSPMSPLIARQVLKRMREAASASRTVRPTPRPADTAGSPEARRLTHREWETLELIARGYSYDELGEQLGMGLNTVRHHIRSIYAKLGVHSKIEAVNEARRRNWLPSV